MSELFALLERQAVEVQPSPDALDGIMRGVRRRRITRRVASGSTALLVLAGAMAAVPLVQQRLRPTRQVIAIGPQANAQTPALALRTQLGIEGRTKGAPDSVVVRQHLAAGDAQLSLVQIQSGKSVKLNSRVEDATVSPEGDVMAAVSDDSQLVVGSTQTWHPATVPSSSSRVGAQVSWDEGGGALFTRLDGRWVRVNNPAPAGPHSDIAPTIQKLNVPSIAGGPVLMSVSPGGDLALLFGVTWVKHVGATPHLSLGDFDGVSVTHPKKIAVPPGAVEGPMGWVGENAFLLAPADGEALIVRTDGTRILVHADPMGDPCQLVAPAVQCRTAGPRLLGTDAAGSLLFWKLGAKEGTGQPASVVLYYKTWLDGSHVMRLVGLAGVYGPPVAAR
jgi:hypothetical protein